jgi:hypothetical protein
VKQISDKTLVPICAKYNVWQTSKCVEGLKWILKEMSPRALQTGTGSVWLTYLSGIEKLLSSKKIALALQDAAVNLHRFIRSGQTPETDLYTLLESALLKQGLTKSEAIEAAILVLGVYSTRGPGIGNSLWPFTTSTLAIGVDDLMSVIAVGSLVLDSRALNAGRPLFSYPPGVTSTVENSKPYHFWGAAFLAYEVAKQSKNAEVGTHAAWIAQLGYQMKSTTNGRDPTRAFGLNALSPENNKIRLDLAHAAAGAVFGAKMSTPSPIKKPINVDEVLRSLLMGSNNLKPVSQEEAQNLFSKNNGIGAFVRWNQIFAPDVGLKHAKRSL